MKQGSKVSSKEDSNAASEESHEVVGKPQSLRGLRRRKYDRP